MQLNMPTIDLITARDQQLRSVRDIYIKPKLFSPWVEGVQWSLGNESEKNSLKHSINESVENKLSSEEGRGNMKYNKIDSSHLPTYLLFNK